MAVSAFRAALVAASAAVLTAACAAGQHAATAEQQPALDGTQGQVGSIELEGVSLHAPTQPAYAPGSDVAMTVYIVNNGHTGDTLTKVTSPAFPGGWDVVAADSMSAGAGAPSSTTPSAAASPATGTPLLVGAGAAVGLGLTQLDSQGGRSTQVLVLKGLSGKPLYPGTTVQITFTFANAGAATLSVPVQITTTPNSQTLPAGSESPAE